MVVYDIDWLRENSTRLLAFGSGFVQVVVNPVERLHFHYPALAGLKVVGDDEFHNHRYDFLSHVKLGAIFNETAEFEVWDETAAYAEFNVSCQRGKAAPIIADNFRIPNHDHAVREVRANDSYIMPMDLFHKVTVYENTITHLYRGKTAKEFAQVVRPVNSEPICPFSVKMAKEDCWQIVDVLLKEFNNEKVS